ncbi:MAG TPA: NYN domain-containing protein [candidate division Zixibacteria bacterium]|nr:NYN domain-containing protein [candidate division Zixibacteria bacterium]
MSTRVAIFVDGANMFYAQRDMGWRIEYKKVLEFFSTNKTLASANYFTATPPVYKIEAVEKYRKFKQALIYIGYSVIDKEVRVFQDKETGQVKLKGNLDIDMAFKMLSQVTSYDEAVLLGGDSDFVPIIQYLSNLGKAVICVGRKESTALELRNYATKFIELGEIRDRIEKTK